MIAELHDGRKLEFPDGTDPAVVQATVKKVLGGGAPAPAEQPASFTDRLAGNPASRLLQGAFIDPVLGIAQMGANAVSPQAGQKVNDFIKAKEEAKQRGMAAGGAGNDLNDLLGNFDGMGLLGNLYPAGAISKGVAKALPLTTLPGRAIQGAAAGGAIAAATPVTQGNDYWSDKGAQVGFGAATGGLVPPVTDLIRSGYNAGKRMLDPATLLRHSQDEMLGNNPSAKAKVIQALQNAREIVPGSKPTAGEAMADIPEATGLASHQKTLAKAEGISPKFAARSAQQEAARVAAISDVAKTPSDLANAIQERAAGAKINYAAANAKSVESDAGLKELLQRPSMSKILSRAKDLAREQGKTFQIGEDIAEHVESSPILDRTGQAIKTVVPEQKSQYPVESLHYMKMAMDDLIKNPERFGIGASEARAIGGTQRKLIDWLGEKSPAYNEARQAFAADSIPINQMQVGQELKKALQTPTTKGERSTVFMNAVRDAPKMMKRATGSDLFDTIGEVLDPQQTKAVMDVGKDLSRKDAFRLLSMKTNLSGGNALADTAHMPNLLSRPAAIANILLKHIQGDVNLKANRLAAEQYLHPEKLLAGLEDIPPSARQQMVEAIMKRAGVPLSVGAARQF